MDATKSILLVSDQDKSAKLAWVALCSVTPSSRISSARDESEAIRHCEQHHFSLIILDLRESCPAELLNRIHKQQRFTPVVLLTDRCRPDIMRPFAKNISSVISRPKSQKMYQEVMRELANYWLNYNVSPKA